jgi:hypothetical protein
MLTEAEQEGGSQFDPNRTAPRPVGADTIAILGELG